MGAMSIWHWLIVLLLLASVYGTGRILWRLGFSPFWTVLACVPLVNMIMLLVLAHVGWPIDRNRAADQF